MPRSQLLGIVDYINGHFTGEIKLKALGPRFGLSPSRLTRLLKKETGFNFKQLLRGKRLALSRELLGRMSVTEACFEAGFESLSHFSRLFRSRYGESPSEYRRGLFRRGLNQALLADAETSRREGGQRAVSLAEAYHRKILQSLAEPGGRELEKIQSWVEAGRERLERGRRIVLLSYDSEGLELETLSGRHRGPAGPGSQERWYPVRKSFDPDREEISIACPDRRGLLRTGPGDLLLTTVPCPALVWTSGTFTGVVGPDGPTSGALNSANLGPVTAWCRAMEDGLLSVPEMPMTPFAPGSSIAQLVLRSVILAGMTGRQPGQAAGEGWGPALLGPVKALAENAFLTRETGVRMAEKVIAGGRLYLGGPRKSLNEFIWRSAGLMGLRPLDSGRPTEKDVALIDASAGWEPAVRRYAPLLSGRRASVIVVSMGPGPEPALTLSEAGQGPMDRWLGRHGRNGGDQKPVRTPSLEGRILSYVLIWMLFASYLQEMIARGHVPFVFRGFHVRGGKKYNEAAYPLCLERGY